MSEPAETGLDVRLCARAGFGGLTVGRAPGYVQANLFVLPEIHAAAFETFCRLNPLACPLLAVGEPGSPRFPGLGDDLDLRSDLPAYRVHQNGRVWAVGEISGFWRDDLVAFAVGCWFGAEAALAAAGVRLRHVELGVQESLFRTALQAAPVGPFNGPQVVSMRPFADKDVARVVAITTPLVRSHGAPIHQGNPAALGIRDIAHPDWGEPIAPEPGETLLFWPCGLTALAALHNAKLPFFVTHAPGSMLVTDLQEDGEPIEAPSLCNAQILEETSS